MYYLDAPEDGLANMLDVVLGTVDREDLDRIWRRVNWSPRGSFGGITA